ncbi:TM2 domain [Carpediemonas membranifera]|uniref:TM2 domain n=1 Tax=Carpediemonas membranifera TaxID=201153 RepID=A0A8J6AXL0_9EUKA|nr:TM2 domain [Carpediemonas membranifera]|eukprot:KAG9390888.1 TM2 domain [Carpediemonas membranifera]
MMTDTKAPELLSLKKAYLFWLLGFIGLNGMQRFYCRQRLAGFILLLTFGLFGVGQLLDGITLAFTVDKANVPLERKPFCMPKTSHVGENAV